MKGNNSRQPSNIIEQVMSLWGLMWVGNGFMTKEILCPYCTHSLVHELFAQGGAVWKCLHCKRAGGAPNYLFSTKDQSHFPKCPVCTGKDCVCCRGRGWVRL